MTFDNTSAQSRDDWPLRSAGAALMLSMLAACATPTPPGEPGATATPSFAIDQEVMIEGRVASADMAPWTYDGNAIVVVTTSAHGPVKVQLPARWNLCRAKGIGTASSLKTGDRVRIAGTATDPDTLTVCEGTAHRIERI